MKYKFIKYAKCYIILSFIHRLDKNSMFMYNFCINCPEIDCVKLLLVIINIKVKWHFLGVTLVLTLQCFML